MTWFCEFVLDMLRQVCGSGLEKQRFRAEDTLQQLSDCARDTVHLETCWCSMVSASKRSRCKATLMAGSAGEIRLCMDTSPAWWAERAIRWMTRYDSRLSRRPARVYVGVVCV